MAYRLHLIFSRESCLRGSGEDAMLDPWIIEEIRRREEEEERRHREQRPVLEIPLDVPIVPTSRPDPDKEERGVVIVDFRV
jgi:hypothetical protein